jgi:F420-dependent oxidoreductase-like protein
MRIGINAGYWQSGPPSGIEQAILAADDAGVDSFWTSEAYGSDALTPLAWWGATTKNIRLGTAVMQMSARTPTAAAMAAITLDHLSGGRFIMGLGVSGPQVVEGWYGQPYARPLARTREYVDIVRQTFRREAPVTAHGRFYQLPLAPGSGEGVTGLGKALKPTVHPLRTDLPIHLAAEGPKNIALAAEICDGWLPLFYSPRLDAEFRDLLADGFARRAEDISPTQQFEVSATVPVVAHDNLDDALAAIRPFFALYIGGMGAQSANFHRSAVERLGYGEICDDVAALYQTGNPSDKAKAAELIPLELIDDVALVGPVSRIAEGLRRWENTAVTSILVQGDHSAVTALLQANATISS